MKFLCDSCGTKYAISDERVRGRVLKIRCKKCDFVITVREDAAASSAVQMLDPLGLPSADELGKAFDSTLGGDEKTTLGDAGSDLLKSAMPLASEAKSEKSDDDWYVSFDGEQEGPFSLLRAIERVRVEHGGGKESHAWRPGYMVWLPVEEVPELEPALKKAPPRTPVRAMTATPIGAARGTGSGKIAAHIAKDPSGPRAALAVSAGAPPTRPAMQGVTMSPTSTGLPSRSPSLFAGASGAPAARPAPAFPKPSLSNNPPTLDPDELLQEDHSSPGLLLPPAPAEGAPDLPISNEASGLMNLEHLAAAAMGKPMAGPAFVNGHTGPNQRLPSGGQPRMQSGQHARLGTGRQRALAEPLAALDALEPSENPSTAAPVVVMAGAASSGTNPLFKWLALVAGFGCIGLGVGMWYLLTHRPAAETIIVTEPSRHVDDTAITVTDPVTGKPIATDPKHTMGPVTKKIAAVPRPAAGGKQGDGMSGSQRALADLYKDDGDKATPHALPTAGHAEAQGGQANQAAIVNVVNQNRRGLNLCYERVLKHDNSLKQGRVVVQLTIGISGRVTSVTIPDAQYATSELGQCFTQTVKRWNFPPNDAPYSTEFPFILQGQ